MAIIIRKEKSFSEVERHRKAQALEVSDHAILVTAATKWLSNQGCGVVLAELVANTPTGEVPDAIGWRGGSGGLVSIVVECKTTRADFLRDKGKAFRISPKTGMGDWRFYLSPPGVISVEDLPPGWGLLHAQRSRVLKVSGVPGNVYWGNPEHIPFNGHKIAEMAMLYSALRREQQDRGAKNTRVDVGPGMPMP